MICVVILLNNVSQFLVYSLQCISYSKLLNINGYNLINRKSLEKYWEQGMGKKASLNIRQRAQIVTLSKMKLSEIQIGKKLKVSKTRPLFIMPTKNLPTKELLQTGRQQDVPRFD